MSDKTKKNLMLSAAIVAALIILWLLSRGSQVMGAGGRLGDIAGPGAININRAQYPGLGGITIPAAWVPPARSCGCGCDRSRSSGFNLSGYPPGIMSAQSGVF